jgi:hypothetical protein
MLKRKPLRRHRGSRTYLLKEATGRPSERLNCREHKLSLLEPLWVLLEVLLLPVV